MASIYETTRQQEIASKAARKYGIDPNNITAINTKFDIPTAITYSDNNGTNITRDIQPLYGEVLTNDERDQIKNDRLLADQAQGLESLYNYQNSYDQAKDPRLLAKEVTPRSSINNPSMFDPSYNRLASSGLPVGAQFSSKDTSPIIKFRTSAGSDYRVRILVPASSDLQKILLETPTMSVLNDTNGVLFPYTPQITVNHTASYNSENLTHSNYAYQFYQSSTVEEITIVGTFASKNAKDASYVVAAQHFFRTVTKMFYGQDSLAGVPPPVLRLDGHGDLQFSSVPIVITGFSSSYPDDVDYITTQNTNFETRVPVIQTFTINCRPVYSRRSISNDFSFEGFASGNLLAVKNGRGGFL